MAAYGAKHHALSIYVILLVTTEEEGSLLFIKGLYYVLQLLSFHMACTRRIFMKYQTMLR